MMDSRGVELDLYCELLLQQGMRPLNERQHQAGSVPVPSPMKRRELLFCLLKGSGMTSQLSNSLLGSKLKRISKAVFQGGHVYSVVGFV